MAIENIGGYDAGTQTKQLTGQSQLGKDEFLNLLVTQLQYQDPLNPMDSTDFTAQLAQFSSLEQLSQLNGKFDTLASSQAALNNTQAVSYIGRSILADGNGIEFDGASPVSCHFQLAGASAETWVSVYDGAGDYVRSFDAGAMDAGYRSAGWDGRDQNGNLLPPGRYHFDIAAVNGAGESVAASHLSTGLVTGVVYKNGYPYVVAGGQEIAVDAIRQVTASEAQ